MDNVKNVGIEISDKSVELKDGELVGKIVGHHQGQSGWLKVSVEGGISALPFINGAIDWLEAKIPGDQKAWASLAKDALSKIKL